MSDHGTFDNKKHWIAVVDDDPNMLANAKSLLGEENLRVNCLRSGSDLLKFIEKNTPDLILLDFFMPEMNGFTTFKALREYEEKNGRRQVPVIFLTGDDDSETEQEGLKLGASDYIRKPFKKEILLRRIENTINNNKTIETLTEEAMVDKLTGFLNKARGTDRITKLCARKKGALMILDLDSFKLVNDLFGHEMGDKVLKAFADIIRNGTRETDTISRIGGDEFLVFCDDMTAESAVASFTERINARLREDAVKLMGEDNGIPLGISVGAVMVPESGRDFKALFALADSALYTVKQNGKHGYSINGGAAELEITESGDLTKKLGQVKKIIGERNAGGEAQLLGSDSFTLIYRFFMRYNKRYGTRAALILFSVSVPEDGRVRLADACSSFASCLQKALGMSDLIMQSGANCFLVLMTGRTREEAEEDIEGIMREWDEAAHEDGVRIDHVLECIDHEKDN